MKIIKPSVKLLEQGPGIDGMFKFIEYCGRVAYKSEDKISENSWDRFCRMLTDKGHWAVLEHGTVYLKFKDEVLPEFEKLQGTKPFTRWTKEGDYIYLTTNYRIICQLNLQEFMQNNWTEPEKYHYRRVGSHWICSRTTSHQLVRHRKFSVTMESQRYCNYGKDKFENSLTYILPSWVYDIRYDIAETVDPQTYESRSYIKDLDGEELWEELTVWDRTVSGRDDIWRAIEREYLDDISGTDGAKLKPEDARGILCNDTKTELVMTGYLEDWFYKAPGDSKEKAGFFTLRCAPDAQRDIRMLAQNLQDEMFANGMDKWK